MCIEICFIESCSTFSIPITSLEIVVNLNFVSRKKIIKGGRPKNKFFLFMVSYGSLKLKTKLTLQQTCLVIYLLK